METNAQQGTSLLRKFRWFLVPTALVFMGFVFLNARFTSSTSTIPVNSQLIDESRKSSFAVSTRFATQKKTGDSIYTVSGRIPIAKLGFSLTHEHIASNFGGDPSLDPQYNTALLYDQVIPYLKKIKSQGVNTIFDCTTAYFGRDVLLLKALADSTGIQIITNTGFYGASDDRYVPEFAFEHTADQIAELWIAEFENGIADTGIRPGFIKLAFDKGEPSDIDYKLFEAGILTHLRTGLTMVVHTQNNLLAANKQLEMLRLHGISPRAWVWAHAHQVSDINLLLEAAANGAYISLDGVNATNFLSIVTTLIHFKKKNQLHQVLLSHDGNSYPRGGAIRPYEAIQTLLIPKLFEQGFTADEINLLTIANPQQAFAIRIRIQK